MQILHKVQLGDTVSSISEQYQISISRLMEDNGLSPNSTLSIGQIIAIVYPKQTYIVKDGDSLFSIAQENGVSIMELLRNNPTLSERDFLEVGEELVISYENKDKRIRVNGWTFTFINERVLRKTLPFLTSITIMGHQVDAFGNLSDIDDTNISRIAVDYGVIPLMFVSSLDETGQGTTEITHALFNSQDLQKTLIDNIIAEVTIKGYYGAYFGFQYIMLEDLQKYTDFIILATQRLHDSGYISGVVLLPSTFGYSQGRIDNQSYYQQIGQWVDEVTLLSFQWATSYIPDAYQTTYSYIVEYLNAVIELIPPEKIYLGLSRIAYDWELPYVEDESFVSSLTTPGALALANQYGSEIYFDETTQTPYFEYRLVDTDHVVWFKDARYTNSILSLVNDYGLGGISVWNIMFFYRIWLMINSQFDIIKV